MCGTAFDLVMNTLWQSKYHLGHTILYVHSHHSPSQGWNMPYVHNLHSILQPPSVNKCFFFIPEISSVAIGDLLTFRDCAELLKSGVTDSGVYAIRLPNSTQTVKVVAALKGYWPFLAKII